MGTYVVLKPVYNVNFTDTSAIRNAGFKNGALTISCRLCLLVTPEV